MSLVFSKFRGIPSKNGNEYRICCFKCDERTGSPDTKFHLYINTKKDVFHCFRCGWGGRTSYLLKQFDGTELEPEPKQFRLEEVRKRIRKIDVPRTEIEIPGYQPLLDKNLNLRGPEILYRYLKQRGLSDKRIRSWEIGFSKAEKRFIGRIIFPIRDLDGLLVFYQARAIRPDAKPKYLNPSENKDYAIGNLRSAIRYREVGIVEGRFDCVLPNCITGFGKTLTVPQLTIIRSIWKEAVVLLDADAYSAAIELGKQLWSFGIRTRIGRLESGDPDSNGARRVEEAFANAIPYSSRLRLRGDSR